MYACKYAGCQVASLMGGWNSEVESHMYVERNTVQSLGILVQSRGGLRRGSKYKVHTSC